MFKFLNNLCRPAFIYFIISLVAITIILGQNLFENKPGVYCVGMQRCSVPSVLSIFLAKIVYVLLWTWLLNYLCSKGYVSVSWFLLLLPLISMFIVIAIIMFIFAGTIALSEHTPSSIGYI